jgi:hypothetical protein
VARATSTSRLVGGKASGSSWSSKRTRAGRFSTGRAPRRPRHRTRAVSRGERPPRGPPPQREPEDLAPAGGLARPAEPLTAIGLSIESLRGGSRDRPRRGPRSTISPVRAADSPDGSTTSSRSHASRRDGASPMPSRPPQRTSSGRPGKGSRSSSLRTRFTFRSRPTAPTPTSTRRSSPRSSSTSSRTRLAPRPREPRSS